MKYLSHLGFGKHRRNMFCAMNSQKIAMEA